LSASVALVEGIAGSCGRAYAGRRFAGCLIKQSRD
jgi:hypothetical protein